MGVVAVVTLAVGVEAYLFSTDTAIKSGSENSVQQVNSQPLNVNNPFMQNLGTLGQPLAQQQITYIPPVAQSLAPLGTSASGGPLMPIFEYPDAMVSIGQQIEDYPDTIDGLKTTGTLLPKVPSDFNPNTIPIFNPMYIPYLDPQDQYLPGYILPPPDPQLPGALPDDSKIHYYVDKCGHPLYLGMGPPPAGAIMVW